MLPSVILLLLFTAECSISQRRGKLGADVSQAVEFDCPEEFGYYPHPSDCTQYYVCVFGGALLESCTGGLMYSHELQTCDWPRNVGCGLEGEPATVSTVRVTDSRTRKLPATVQSPSRSQVLSARIQSQQQTRQEDELAKHRLYAEDVGPAEEIESDRPQRVYRGQPSTIGQVARDRDGLLHQPVTNALPTSTGRAGAEDKVAFGVPQHYRVEPTAVRNQQTQSKQQLSPAQNQVAYNTSRQEYDQAQYDPYYNLYDEEDVELYRDVDYSQYNSNTGPTGNVNYASHNYKQTPTAQREQKSSSYAQPTFGTQDVYGQTLSAQDYEKNYNTPVDDQYQQNLAVQQPVKNPTRKVMRQREEQTTQSIESTIIDKLWTPYLLSTQTSKADVKETQPLQGRSIHSTESSQARKLSETQRTVNPDGSKSSTSDPASVNQMTARSRAIQHHHSTAEQSPASYKSRQVSGYIREQARKKENSLSEHTATDNLLPSDYNSQSHIDTVTEKISPNSRQSLRPTTERFREDIDTDRNSILQPDMTTVRSRGRINTQQRKQTSSCLESFETNVNVDCKEKPQVRVRPATSPPVIQSTSGSTRGSTTSRTRGSASYTTSGTSGSVETVNRGTPASVRTRPTLKPSTAIVSKATEFVDIYKFPPSRPDPVYPTPQPDKTAAKCRKDVCLLPDCSCGGKDIPGGYSAEEIPQIVLLTFDDSANDLNKGLYSDLFDKGRTNPNGCPIAATFYVSHEWTDYSHVQNLYSAGHEIASHSISHSFGEKFSQKKWTKEIAGQREILAAYGGVRLEDIRGMRAPFLAVGGNKMFKMLYDSNFTYDSSMPVYENKPPSFPYTLDYKLFHDCMIPPCPTRSYPGVWEVPMVMWQDLNGGRCSMGDACSNPPTADGVYKMLIKNFERHYTTNRAPFGLFYHAAWFTQAHHKEGFIAFLDTIVAMQDVWLVTNSQAIQWVRDPTPLSRINSFQPFQCNYPERPKKCNNPKVCNLWHKSGVRYMRTCQPCPDIYPWTGKTGVRNSRVDNDIVEES